MLLLISFLVRDPLHSVIVHLPVGPPYKDALMLGVQDEEVSLSHSLNLVEVENRVVMVTAFLRSVFVNFFALVRACFLGFP